MYLIVGLGNPGGPYKGTPHNVGFAALDAFAASNAFPGPELSKKHRSFVSEGFVGGQKIVLAWPQTYMNSSGEAVSSLLSFYKIPVSSLVVLHDDIDIPAGAAKTVQSRGSAGHKGVESVVRSIGTQDFTRVRIGVQPPAGKPADVERYVLQKPSPEESSAIAEGIRKAAEELRAILETK